MGRGRKPKPTHLKAVGGTLRKDRINANEPKIEPTQGLKAPDFLDKLARDEWDRVAPLVERMKVLSAADRSALAGYCTNYSRWVKAETALQKCGITYESRTESGGIIVRKSPLIEISNQAQRQMLAFASEFGLTPASRSRLSVETPPPGGNDPWGTL